MTQEAPAAPPPVEPGPITKLLQTLLPGVEFVPGEAPLDETVTIRRDDFAKVMGTLRNEPKLDFDYLRCLSGMDWLTELEVVYHFYSYKYGHTIAVKTRCPYNDAHVPTVSHIWEAANWHERETQELYGIVFDGHPDPRVLLTEEGLGYYIMRKTHPLAEIEEWQEGYLDEIEKARQAMWAGPAGQAAPVDEKALKIQMAQAKAKVMTTARAEARSKGMEPADEKAFVTAAIKKFEEEWAAQQAAAAAGGGGGAPVDPKAAKIAAAQAKARVITKSREEARAKGMSTEEEKAYVAEALKKHAEAAAAAPVAAAPAAPSGPPPDPRAAKIQMAQAKARLITKARAEARDKGMSTEDEKAYVAEALKKFAEENK